MLHVSRPQNSTSAAGGCTCWVLTPVSDAPVLLCCCVFVGQNPVRQAPEMQSSTAELITGLVQLVPLTNTTQLSQEAMEVRTSPAPSANTHTHTHTADAH